MYYYFRRVGKKALGDDGILLPLTTTFLQVNMDGYDYDAAASTIKIEDITTDEDNQNILRRLKGNDPDFDKLWVTSSRDDEYDYCPGGARDSGWLGYFIGKNTTLKEMYLYSSPFNGFNNAIGQFCRGANFNRSIQKIGFHSMNLSGGEIFQSLRPFFENNNNISKIVVDGGQFGAGCARQLSLALRDCNRSLKHIKLVDNEVGVERLVDIIEALSEHPQLETLRLPSMNIGIGSREYMMALVNLLSHAVTELQELNLCNNDIDDEGIHAFMGALANSRLSVLDLSTNSNISGRGWQSLAAMLERPNSNLEKLHLGFNNIGDEGARIFANALTNNCKLKILSLHHNGITAQGWPSLSKVLCDTSSINNTFLSNHTLEGFGVDAVNLPSELTSLLALNRRFEDKKQVAIKKILKHHQHFDMQPFFEWELKVLPIAVSWFERAQSIEDADEEGIGKCKLSTIYQFVRAVPEVFEPVPAAAGGEKRK